MTGSPPTTHNGAHARADFAQAYAERLRALRLAWDAAPPGVILEEAPPDPPHRMFIDVGEFLDMGFHLFERSP